jgi:ribosomal protein S18 acetylase RimI-like enzyme
MVRPARRDDVPSAARLAARLVRQHHDFDPLRFMSIEPLEAGYERFLASQLDRPGVVFLVADEADTTGAVAGYIYATLEERDWSDLRDACGKIHDVYVDERVRRRGVASQLVEAAVSRLAELGAPRVVLMAAWRNEEARVFFARLGFRPTMLEMTRET